MRDRILTATLFVLWLVGVALAYTLGKSHMEHKIADHLRKQQRRNRPPYPDERGGNNGPHGRP